MPNMESAPVATPDQSSDAPQVDTLADVPQVDILAAKAVAYAEVILAAHLSQEEAYRRIVDDVDDGLIPELVAMRTVQLIGV